MDKIQWRKKGLCTHNVFVMCCIVLRISLKSLSTVYKSQQSINQSINHFNGLMFQQHTVLCNTSRVLQYKNYNNLVFLFCLLKNKQQQQKKKIVDAIEHFETLRILWKIFNDNICD